MRTGFLIELLHKITSIPLIQNVLYTHNEVIENFGKPSGMFWSIPPVIPLNMHIPGMKCEYLHEYWTNLYNLKFVELSMKMDF